MWKRPRRRGFGIISGHGREGEGSEGEDAVKEGKYSGRVRAQARAS